MECSADVENNMTLLYKMRNDKHCCRVCKTEYDDGSLRTRDIKFVTEKNAIRRMNNLDTMLSLCKP